MRTLYVSDLDGTLLRSDERTSGYTNRTVNRLVGEGMLFSYATARSFQTARKVTAGLEAEIPLIVYNGAAVADNRDGSFLQMNFSAGKRRRSWTNWRRAACSPSSMRWPGAERCFPICLPGVRGECGRSLRRGKRQKGEPRRNAAHTACGGYFLLHLY